MRRMLLFLIMLLALLAAPSRARADVAPPEPPPGSSLQPGTEATKVRMLAETVLIDVQPGSPDGSLGSARVTADFTMHNTGDAPESMAALFPIAANDGWGRINLISDFRVRVGGNPVNTRQIMLQDPNLPGSAEVPWAQFDVTFPAQQDVRIQAQYTLQGGGELPFSKFTYILSTGAGWKDTIGSADIVVQLPYAASIENLLVDDSTPNGSLDGQAVRWHYSDLEPTTKDNFAVTLVTPSRWQQLLDEQSNVALHPADGESWGRIGKLCKEMAFSSRRKGFRLFSDHLDPGAAQLYRLAVQAYEKAVTLLPKDALWHAGYADLLGYHAYFEAMTGTNTDEEVARSLSEIQIAQQLAPNDPQVQEIAHEISGYFPGGQIPNQSQPGLTATATLSAPTASPTKEATAAASATPSRAATPSAEATAAPTPKPATGLCGSALLVPVLLLALVYARPGFKNRGR